MAMLQLRQLDPSFSLWRPRINPRSLHVQFMCIKWQLGQIFFKYFSFPIQFSFYQVLHFSSYHKELVQWATDDPSTKDLSHTPQYSGAMI
jgi:hypothetical protein